MAGARKQLGNFGEKIAADYLKNKGYKILGRNFFFRMEKIAIAKGEIDIIAKKDKIISFVEVKTLSKDKGFEPEDEVDFKKQKKLIKLAEIWLNKNKIALDTKWQIDVIAIKVNLETKKARIRHFENVVSC
jgi:putative endonuclease